MLRSMTGFGASSGQAGGRGVRVEVRSVNHRHLQVKTRLPHELAFLEGELESAVKKRLKRGSVTLHVEAPRAAASEAARVNLDVAERYRAQLATLSKSCGGDGSVPLAALVGLPGVVGVPEDDPAALRREGKGVVKCAAEALARLVEMRETEGAALLADLRKNARAAAALVDRIEKRMPAVVKAHQKALGARVAELLGDRHPLDGADLAREVALIADRIDVSEEVSRLRSHFDQFEAFLAKGGDVGRKLEFLVQEIHRETNTVGSKCNDTKVSHWVIDLKTRIERLREQVQNVE